METVTYKCDRHGVFSLRVRRTRKRHWRKCPVCGMVCVEYQTPPAALSIEGGYYAKREREGAYVVTDGDYKNMGFETDKSDEPEARRGVLSAQADRTGKKHRPVKELGHALRMGDPLVRLTE